MYIKSIVLEGFKSYGHRVEVNGFDREFNAITGLNGSGKSNILDSICFVLGITNLGNVRATALQDLVYKCGQAGITKATVSITFDNKDKTHCPIGYENYDEITVTRQVVIGGKNKYLINGINVQNKRVNDLFCSIQLNVNNPNFIIMQGRIGKVLKMRPPEILSLVEEAAGTKMYEAKKQAAQRTIEKKDAKLKELSDIITEEIAPKIQKLQDERTQFQEYQKVTRELENLTRLVVAWRYVTAEENTEKATRMVDDVKDQIKERNQKMLDNTKEYTNMEKLVAELNTKMDEETGGELQAIEKDVQTKEAKEADVSAKNKSGHDGLRTHQSKQRILQNSVNDDEKTLKVKEEQLNEMESSFGGLREAMKRDSELLSAVQERFQAVSSGLQLTEGGQASLQDQLMAAKQMASEASTRVSQCQMEKKHLEERLGVLQKDVAATSLQYRKDQANISSMEKEVAKLQRDLSSVGYDEARITELNRKRNELFPSVRRLNERTDNLSAQLRRCNFTYSDPTPGFDRSKVKGTVCRLFDVNEPEFCTALETVAGGKLYNVIVDTDVTSKMILQKGQLQQRTTIIPLNKIQGRAPDPQILKTAQEIVGAENVHMAISLISFAPELRAAMNWVFGDTLVCPDLDTARRVTYHPRIMRRCVTLDGDVVDPAGTLSGGAALKGGSVLVQLKELKQLESQLQDSENQLKQIESEINGANQAYEKYTNLKQRWEVKSVEVNAVKLRMQTTTTHQLHSEVEELNLKVGELAQQIVDSKKLQVENDTKAKNLETQMKDLKGHREREMSAVENELKKIKKQAENSRNLWKQREQEFETLKLEVSELGRAAEGGRQQLVAGEEALAQLQLQVQQSDRDLAQIKEIVKTAQALVKAKKSDIASQSNEIKKTLRKKEHLMTRNSEIELEIKELGHRVTKLQTEAAGCASKMEAMKRKYEWIASEREYFGEPGGLYDFREREPVAAGQRLQQLEQRKDKLARNVNARAHSLLGKEEEQYSELMKKKKIVENDRAKLVQVMSELDEKKRKALLSACQQVNRDFGSIFSTLLYGAQAKLVPPEGQTVLDGLEVKVGFNGVWKEGLGELSGGQGSLVALSLILAMLLYRPAPLYILDEVDAALDLSHTQNIGSMLSKHFKHSQFIVVSLKEGMFHNANVLFRTKFVDGMSTVQRTVNPKK